MYDTRALAQQIFEVVLPDLLETTRDDDTRHALVVYGPDEDELGIKLRPEDNGGFEVNVITTVTDTSFNNGLRDALAELVKDGSRINAIGLNVGDIPDDFRDFVVTFRD